MLIALNPKPDVTNPLDELKYLSNPSQWTPLQVHDFAEEIKRYVPKGRILTLIPMIPLEAGYDIYPFTVNRTVFVADLIRCCRLRDAHDMMSFRLKNWPPY